MAVINSIADRHEDMRGWRHLLHAHPEIAYEEVWTSDFIANKLALAAPLMQSCFFFLISRFTTLTRTHAAR